MFRLFLATLIIGIFGSAQPGAGDRGPQMVLDLLRNGNGSMVFLMCDNAVRSAVSVEQLSSLWGGLESQMGKYSSNGGWHDLDGVPGGKWCNLSFENGKVSLMTVFDSDGKIAGLQIAPPLPEPAPDEEFSDIHELAEGWEEKELAVHTGKFKLPARLTVPRQKAPDSIPVLILVHGSGPNDMDETLGPNKLFKEIAAAMSHRGIAVLRYDKRTYVYDKKAVMAGLCAKAFPMLFLQGGRDYQVPAEEIRIWEAWADEAGGNADARFISYPGLNHIFHKGEGEPSPAEYAVQGKIPGEVLDDIAGFLKIRL